ncbi:MAG: TolC family protein, partial [Planctomycetes bacterium]|nr:TolC family protein [Planctomycetota bacterium]
IARNSRRASLYDFQMAVMEVIAQVERAYWGLVFAYGDLTVRGRSLELAEELLESNRQRVEAEILAPSEIVRAESSVAARQASILDAQTAVHDAEDTLRRLMNPPDSELTDDLTVVPVDGPPKDYQPVDGKRAICQALTNRPDFIAQKTDVENLGIDLVLSRNELLPTLDLTLFYRSKGAGRSLDTSFDRYSSLLFDDFGATIEFSVPLEQRTAKGAVTEARLALQQALLELKDSEDAIVVEVRRQLRRVRAKHELITRFHWAWELAGKRLNAEDEKLLLGTATTLDVLEAQRELTSAGRDELRASVDFNIALVDLRRATGSLLTDYQVHFSDR